MEKNAGFTMIELMIVLVILGVIASQLVPSLQRYVVRTRRTEAQAALLMLMQQQERFFTQNNRYVAFSADASEPEARPFTWWSGVTAARSAYEIEGKACEGSTLAACIELTATPGTDRVDPHFRDADCLVLKLSSDGLRTASGPMTGCWP
ncbi:type IV pilin protein [Oxalobacteraceae bacterium]|nr:type IV pilin protein [Oxalobacteraceae bacterium]